MRALWYVYTDSCAPRFALILHGHISGCGTSRFYPKWRRSSPCACRSVSCYGALGPEFVGTQLSRMSTWVYSEPDGVSTDSIIRLLVIYTINTSALTTYVVQASCNVDSAHHRHSAVELAALVATPVSCVSLSEPHVWLRSSTVFFQRMQLHFLSMRTTHLPM